MYQGQKLIEKILILIIDLFGIIIGNLIAYSIRYQSEALSYLSGDAVWMIAGMCALYTVICVVNDNNRHFFRRGLVDELFEVLKNMAIMLICFIVLLYLAHQSTLFSRLVFGYFAIIGTAIIFIGRILLKKYLLTYYKHSKFSSRLLLVTTSDRAEEIIDHLYERSEWNRLLTGVVIADAAMQGAMIKSYPVVSDKDNLVDYVTHNNIDEVFFSIDGLNKNDYFRDCIATLENMGVIVYTNIEMFNILDNCHKGLDRIGKYAVVTFSRNEFSVRQKILKRLLDIVGSLVGMVFLGIATVIFGPLIKLDSKGPVFFGQTRVGKNGRKFTCYKFRSMYMDAEECKKDLMKQNEMNGLMFKMENDPRITRVGKFIRKTSIDELPQFWNILCGDMSLVGTRPPTVDEYEKYNASHKSRLSMTPGLTGLWQISGRSQIKDFDEVVKLDMEYIDDWNILKDIKIILKTVKVVVCGRGAE